MEKGKHLRKIQEVCFAVHESELYLDTHPKDSDADSYRCKMRAELAKLTDEYEYKYGPLTTKSATVGECGWTWLSGAWPWEYEANIS